MQQGIVSMSLKARQMVYEAKLKQDEAKQSWKDLVALQEELHRWRDAQLREAVLQLASLEDQVELKDEELASMQDSIFKLTQELTAKETIAQFNAAKLAQVRAIHSFMMDACFFADCAAITCCILICNAFVLDGSEFSNVNWMPSPLICINPSS